MTTPSSDRLPSDSNGSDAAGPVSSSTITIGGEAFSVDPRGGTLNYSFTFFNGNVNYGQTPFSLALQYQQTAAGSYVGAFTDSDTHAHPYGVSAYLPTPEPKAKEDGGSQLNDSGGLWDLNLPVLFISTSKISKFYGDNLIAATLSLGDTSYQILMEMPNTNQEDYISAYTKGFLVAAQQTSPLYSIDGRFLSFFQGPQPGEVVVQDKYGTNFLFSATVLYGYKGINIYDPTDNSSNNADADQLLVYRISNIFYANGQTLNFSYTDLSWTGSQDHTVAVSDTIGNTIATLAWDGCTGTVCIANQTGTPVPTHQLTLSPGDFRLLTLQDLSTNRSISYKYVVNQAVPYGWQNQTALANINNDYTGYQTNITYQQFNSNRAYSAGCNQFSLAEIAVRTVTNTDRFDALISQASYDFGFTSSDPNFVMPQASGKKTYASGLNHWLDNIFYDNKDSSGCSASDRVSAVNQEYTTMIRTNYQDPMRNRTQIKRYDAFGRQTEDSISNPAGLLTTTAYRYQATPSELQDLSSFCNLPYSYGSPIATFSSINISTLNGVIINEQSPKLLTYTQQYTYNEAGNPTQEISPLGQVTEYTYLPAAQTNPNNERLVTSVKTHSIGDDGASYILETQTFATFKIAPSDGGIFLAEATLPISNAETHYDATNNSTYAYRTDTMSGYIGGNNYSSGIDVGLNGILTKRGQADNTGASDISALSNQTTASFTTVAGLTQPVLSISSSISGTTKNGDITSMNRGSGLIHFMGYPLQQTNVFKQTSMQTYDDLGRLTSVTTMAGTQWAQTTRYSYDSQDDLKLDNNAFFSRRTVDTYGNSHVQLFDARQRHIASFQTLNGSQTVQTNAYTYDDANNLISATEFGVGYERITSYYYSPGTQLRIASNPSDGLAEGQILDALNGINCHFKYAPASNSSPTIIGQIYGPVRITQTDNTTQLRLADGLLDADAANAALSGLDLIHIPWTTSLIELQGNAWVSSGLVAQPLLAFYQVIAQLPQNNPSAESPCQLMEVNTYTYDEWNRQVSSTCYTFLNHGAGLAATPTLSTTVNSVSFQTAQRAVTRCFPQGQQRTSTYNLLNGLQNATLMVAGLVTDLGSFTHDGLGRILTYNDSINGAQSTATYTDTGLLSSRVDAYGNSTIYLYDPVSFKLIQTSLFPVDGGEAILVNRHYDDHLNFTVVQDSQGNMKQWSYSESGQLASQSIGLGTINTTCPLTTSFSYDNFGDLVHVADPWLPYPQRS
ncbi:MAG: hypothetical protein FJ083_08065, partial [Cyanobacteria bacterium K_Offshore_surface_m2_239]|nr:hypothetical protein [Cyanobacteria bacterium K_Offshore_surface_m2_239]